jgi:uncharacterized protein (DUF433 family)
MATRNLNGDGAQVQSGTMARGHFISDEVHALFQSELHAALADLLGISVEEFESFVAEGTSLRDLMDEYGVESEAVAEAMATARTAAIEEAVAQGLLTAEEAEQLQNAPAFGRRGPGPRVDSEMVGLMQEIFSRDDVHAVIADVLGITVDELEAAFAAGTRLPELADQYDVELSDVHDAVGAARNAAIDAAEAEGTITAEEAAQLRDLPGPRGFGPGGFGPGPGECDGPMNGPHGPRGHRGGGPRGGAGNGTFGPQNGGGFGPGSGA